jgi:hypothetical protein
VSDASDDDLEREAVALLREVREPPATPPEVRARALARLMALPLVSPSNVNPGGGVDPATSVRGAIARALTARVPAWSLIASFVAGGAVAAVAARTAGSSDRAATAAPIATSAATVGSTSGTTSATAATATATATASVPTLVTASAAVPSRPRDPNRGAGGGSASARTADGALEEERSLLDVARTAVGRGDGASALRAAEVHAKKFPRGVLVEEREAMIIQALRLLHRDDEARAKLDRFRGRYPTSLIRPALEAPEDAGAP